jgi:hypothetical protein
MMCDVMATRRFRREQLTYSYITVNSNTDYHWLTLARIAGRASIAHETFSFVQTCMINHNNTKSHRCTIGFALKAHNSCGCIDRRRT